MTESNALIFKDCCATARALFADWLNDLPTRIDEDLSDLLTTENSAERRKLLQDLQKNLNDTWSSTGPRFFAGFNNFIKEKTSDNYRGVEDDLGQLDLSSLKLIDDDQLEFDIELSASTRRLAKDCDDDLPRVYQRLQVVLSAPHLAFEDNPLGLGAIRSGVKEFMEAIGGSVGRRRIVLGMLEKQLIAFLPDFYHNLDEKLEAEGVVPANLSVRRASGSRTSSTRTDSGASEALASLAAGLPADSFSLLRQFMATPPSQSTQANVQDGSSSASPQSATPILAIPPELLTSLNQLQKLTLESLPREGIKDSSALRQIKESEFGKSLKPLDAMTIDVVAMLFDFLFEDPQVPDSIKALIGRLQIPMLKIAMSDKGLFSDRNHPARLFLDAVSRVSVCAGQDVDRQHPLYIKISNVVEQVSDQFDQDMTLFDKVRSELETLLAEQEETAKQIAHQTVRISVEQERRELAEVQSRAIVVTTYEAQRCDTYPVVREFILDYWPEIMRKHFLEGGPDSEPWKKEIGFLSQLLWSLQPKTGAEERARLLTLLPILLKHLHTTLNQLEIPQQNQRSFFDTLVNIHSAVIKLPPRVDKKNRNTLPPERPISAPAAKIIASEDVNTADEPTTVVTRVFQENGVEVETVSIGGKIQSSHPVRLAELGRLQRGDWVEFKRTDPNLPPVRARLHWISPQRGIMLFTNPESSRAISISPSALKFQLKRGMATLLDGDPYVDRALEKASNKPMC